MSDEDWGERQNLARLLVALVKQSGGVVRIAAKDLIKPNSGDRVIIERMDNGEFVLRVDSDEQIQKEVTAAARSLKETIFDMERQRGR